MLPRKQMSGFVIPGFCKSLMSEILEEKIIPQKRKYFDFIFNSMIWKGVFLLIWIKSNWKNSKGLTSVYLYYFLLEFGNLKLEKKTWFCTFFFSFCSPQFVIQPPPFSLTLSLWLTLAISRFIDRQMKSQSVCVSVWLFTAGFCLSYCVCPWHSISVFL